MSQVLLSAVTRRIICRIASWSTGPYEGETTLQEFEVALRDPQLVQDDGRGDYFQFQDEVSLRYARDGKEIELRFAPDVLNMAELNQRAYEDLKNYSPRYFFPGATPYQSHDEVFVSLGEEEGEKYKEQVGNGPAVRGRNGGWYIRFDDDDIR